MNSKSVVMTALKVAAGLIIGFLLLCIVVAVIAPEQPVSQEVKSSNSALPKTATVTPDQAWLNAVAVDSATVLNAGKQLGNDLQGVETYGFQPSLNAANALYIATGTALTRSEGMTVSEELAPAKEDYELAMTYYRTSAYFTYEGVSAATYGRYADMKENLDIGMTNMNWAAEAFSAAAEHIKAYNSKQ